MNDNTVTREQCRTILRTALPDGNLKRLARAHIALLDKLDAERERCARIAEEVCSKFQQFGYGEIIAAEIRRGK